MRQASPEETTRFVDRLRTAIADAIEAVSIQTYSEHERELVAPATIAAALLLSAWDYVAKRGLPFESFVTAMRTYLVTLEQIHNGESKNDDGEQ